MISNKQYPQIKTGILIGSLLFGLSFVICAVILSHTIIRVKGQGQTISVTGAAFKPIVSDLSFWRRRPKLLGV